MLFKDYTGSAMLNNALQTIEALTGTLITNVDANSLLKLFRNPYKDGLHTLTRLNKRLKSYTMLFSKNGPLLNDKTFGEAIYNQLIESILGNAETEGAHTCELSGLRFKTTFDSFYEQTLHRVGYPMSKISGKDKTVNRCWFPLLGGLGSDAQALPQAKYALNVHPICLVIMQFLPLSTVLYKGGVLLIDASNTDLSRQLIAEHVLLIKDKAATGSANSAIDNVKDFTKGHYILKALNILFRKEREDTITAFNLWSFTNSGTGASCEIDHIPNQLISKLRSLYSNPSLRPTLEGILKTPKVQTDFLDALQGNLDFYGLYPNKDSLGVTIQFYEAYQRLIGNSEKLDYAKYIAYLLKKQEWNKTEKKFLSKSDAPKDDYSLYSNMVFEVLVNTSKRREWHWAHHISILNFPNKVPIDASIGRIYRMVHFYFLALVEEEVIYMPKIPDVSESVVGQTVNLFFHLIGEDKRGYYNRWVSSNYQKVSPLPLMVREGSRFYDLETVYPLLYDRENSQVAFGLRNILRIYLNYHHQETLPRFSVQPTNLLPAPTEEQLEYLKKLHCFATEYYTYYRDGRNKGHIDEEKFRQHVLVPMRGETFQIIKWLDTVSESMANFSDPLGKTFTSSYLSEELSYDYTGRYNPSFARFSIEYILNQFYHQLKQTQITI